MVVNPVAEELRMASPPSADGVAASGVWRRFGAVEALRGVDFTARYGEVTGLVGPNGAGKTTLLLVLATLLMPDAGTVRIAGHDPVTETPRRGPGWAGCPMYLACTTT